MSLLWVQANNQVYHDEDQAAHRSIGAALAQTGLQYHPHHQVAGTSTYGTACPNDGTCLTGHTVPQEMGYGVEFNHRHNRLMPIVTHECSEGEIHAVTDSDGTFNHPANGVNTLRTPTDELAGHIKDFATSQAVTDAIMDHHREFHRR